MSETDHPYKGMGMGCVTKKCGNCVVTLLIFNLGWMILYRINACLKAVINTLCGQGMQELDYLEAGEFIHTNGCIDKLVNWLHSNLFLLGGVALGLAIPQLVGILLSQILINQIRDQIKLQSYNLQHKTDPWY